MFWVGDTPAEKLEALKLFSEAAGTTWQEHALEVIDRHRRSSPREQWERRQAERRARGVKEARRISVAVRREVLAEGHCVYCGDFATVVDHVVPVSKGGTRRRSNLVAACSRCNWEKLDWTPEGWQRWRLEMGYSWPPGGLAEMIAALTQ